MNSSFLIKRITSTDTIEAICKQMQPNNWAADNEMTSYQPEALGRFLDNVNNVLVLAYDGDKIAGAALGYILMHPDGNNTFYIHELDTHPDYRRQGVARELMLHCKSLAKTYGVSELWLGADQDNPAANALYASLNPDETDPTVTYTYSIE